MFQQVSIAFIYIVGSFAVIISIGQLFVGTRRVENFNLFALFFLMALQLFQMGFLFNGYAFDNPELICFHLTFTALISPLGYHAYFLVSQPEIKKPVIKKRYFIPAMFISCPDAVYTFSPRVVKAEILHSVFSVSSHTCTELIRSIFVSAGVISILIYAFLLRDLLQLRRSGRNQKLAEISIVFNFASFGLCILFITGYMLGSLLILKFYSVSLCVVIIGAFMISQRRPEFLQLITRQKVITRYTRSRLNGIDEDEVSNKLKFLMEHEKLFTDEELSLKQLSDELGITPHQLSQYLNEKMNSNFNRYINQYRIEEAKQMLISEPERSILSISYGVGFNSKSSFYRAFYQSTNKAPHVYRKEFLSPRLK